MRAKGLTDAQCAKAIGVTQPTVTRYRNGRIPREPYLSRIVQWTDGKVTANDFYRFKSKSPPQEARAE